MTRIVTLSLALIGLAGFCQPAASNTCLPQSAAFHGAHFEHTSRTHHHARYVIIERPHNRTVYEVYEPMPAPLYGVEPGWRSDWVTYDDRPYWHVDYGDW